MKKQKGSSKQPKKSTNAIHRVSTPQNSTLGSLENALALGLQYYQAGQLQAAYTTYQQILQSYPNHLDTLYSLGVISYEVGNTEAAIQYFTTVTQLNPKSIEPYLNLGIIYKSQGKLDLAASSYQRVLALDILNTNTYYNLGEVLALQGNSQAAVENYQKSLIYSNNLLLQGRYVEARKIADYCVQFGNEQQKLTSSYLRVDVYLESGLQKTAYEEFQKIESQLFQNAERFNLEEIKIFYKELFSLSFLRDNVEANTKFCKLIGQLFHKQYSGGKRGAASQKSKVKSQKSKVLVGEPLRIGCISKDFRRHSVGWCSLDVIRELAKLTPSLYIYHTGVSHKDDLTEEFQKITPNFYMWLQEYPNRLVEPSVLREQLLFDQLDVILDLDSLTSLAHAPILCNPPAPICVSWLGFEPPFLSCDNYYLGDWITHPAGVEVHYREKLLRMPNAHMAIAGFKAELKDRKIQRQFLQIADNQIAYLCVGSAKKVNADLIKAQLSILQQVPDGILLHKGVIGDIENVRTMYSQECDAQGVSRQRLRFLDRSPTEEEHRSIYSAVDVLLDTYPYNGGTHNVETLWFNVPLVTRVGEIAPSRMGYSFLKAAGIEEGIAHSWEEYISWGVRLGMDASLRENIRTRLIQSKQPETLAPLWNTKQFAMDMYRLFEELVEGGRGEGRSREAEEVIGVMSPSSPSSPHPPIPPSPPPLQQDEQFLEKLEADVGKVSVQYLENPFHENIIAALRRCREDFVEYLLKLPAQELARFSFSKIEKIHSGLLYTHIQSKELTQKEEEVLGRLLSLIQEELDKLDVTPFNEPPRRQGHQEEQKKIDSSCGSGVSESQENHTGVRHDSTLHRIDVTRYVLASLLYRPIEDLPILRNVSLTHIDGWVLKYYVGYLFSLPYTFEKPGQLETYALHICYWVNYIHKNLFNNPQSEELRKVASIFTKNRSFVQLYFSSINMKEVCSQAADIREFILENRGLELEHIPAKIDEGRSVIRLGILSVDFTPCAETFATLPVFENLDTSQFEVFLYTFNSTGTPFEQYCQKCSQHFVVLPWTLQQQAQRIRADELDILFFAGNLTAITNNFAYLAHHRLAPVQVTSICSPCTTGIRNMDYYIGGDLTSPEATSSGEYREKLLNVPGSGICFTYSNTQAESQLKISRSDLGIGNNKIVFISEANFYKIIPEIRETWAKIISRVPNSVLLLYPFNPNWSPIYPEPYLKELIYTVFTKHNLDRNRLIFLPPVPNPSDIPEYLKLADIYLDSFPYGGATSLVDALKSHRPCVVFEGNTLRFRQAPSLLRELDVPDLITTSEDSYINLAVTLGTNSELRKNKRKEIKRKMQSNPAFLNSKAYSAHMQALFRSILQRE